MMKGVKYTIYIISHRWSVSPHTQERTTHVDKWGANPSKSEDEESEESEVHKP